ncbi:hypothetical protein [Steroidobacter cummioxidans]|uniref:hypothetical protein n=1 Tax=Steroidobacter cummioxidans TaxID=1803913 RepID=UPI0012900921|nr:hypothetical protein [Steroidobacter cummioxidans]
MRISGAWFACLVAVGLGGCNDDSSIAARLGNTIDGLSRTVGGVVAGLSGTVELQNGTEVIAVSTNGAFSFPTPTRVGGPYAVSVRTQPAGATCTVANGNGTVGASNVTNVAVSCQPNTHLVGGSVTGLIGSLTLINGGETYTTSTDGPFSFATPMAEGAAYSVSVHSQPAAQTCSISNGSGTMGTADVATVDVVCSVNTATVGGSVSGLIGSVVVQNNGADTRTISSDGPFDFATAMAWGSSYNVSIQSQPAGQTCTVGNGGGIVGASNVVSVTITCSTNTYTVGGTVSGLSGTVALQNNGADMIVISSNGSFTFSTPVAQGGIYNATVQAHPVGQTCVIVNDSGVMGASNVTNVGVTCAYIQTTISVAARASIPVGSGTGTLQVTNTGSVIASNVAATLPSGWTAVTQDASDCVALSPGTSCNLVFSSTAPYIAQGGIEIAASNVSSPPQVALAFTIGGFSVFSVDSVSTATVIDSAYRGSGRWALVHAMTGADSLTDGAANTALLSSAGSPAADSCLSSTAGGVPTGTWYLPAVCQLTNALGFAGCPAGTPNIYDNLLVLGFNPAYSMPSPIWSSTEYALAPDTFAWAVTPYDDWNESNLAKSFNQPVLCARSIDY